MALAGTALGRLTPVQFACQGNEWRAVHPERYISYPYSLPISRPYRRPKRTASVYRLMADPGALSMQFVRTERKTKGRSPRSIAQHITRPKAFCHS
ncbi:hypothetical protein ALP92_200118 [Pseudomonas syringae pv. primulae]|uniref:Uncharacterized protein n=1 Tax=Pseudomonas syringae pv. primulae TaxID=251707 RepID=A0A3M4RIW3_9PSED|nr:hypothetical protein ALP92_200118 [Pseudomonas syringae pv. primulae]